ncbi:MAG: hypothetical protein WBR13_06815 [Allosphingosinicella sp.]
MMGLRTDRPGLFLAAMALVVLVIIVGLGAMDPSLRRSVVDLFGYGGPHSDESSGSRTLFHTGVPISGIKNGKTYTAYDRRRHAQGTAGFRGFACSGECERHEAGYRWAEAQNVTSPRNCRGPNWEFVEGCAAFVLGKKA